MAVKINGKKLICWPGSIWDTRVLSHHPPSPPSMHREGATREYVRKVKMSDLTKIDISWSTIQKYKQIHFCSLSSQACGIFLHQLKKMNINWNSRYGSPEQRIIGHLWQLAMVMCRTVEKSKIEKMYRNDFFFGKINSIGLINGREIIPLLTYRMVNAVT